MLLMVVIYTQIYQFATKPKFVQTATLPMLIPGNATNKHLVRFVTTWRPALAVSPSEFPRDCKAVLWNVQDLSRDIRSFIVLGLGCFILCPAQHC